MQQQNHSKGQRERRRDRRGVAMVTVLVALVALIAAGSLAIDVGLVWAARTQLQAATDAAALAGAANLIDKTGPAVTLSAAVAATQGQAGLNQSVAASSVNVENADIFVGHWDLASRTFNSSVDLNDPQAVNAVDVTSRSDGVANSPVPTFMARILGRDSFNVTAQATAYLGYAGRVGAGKLDLPIAIDCCKLRGPDCQADYCETITTNPPNPCPLTVPQTQGANTVTCLEFHNTAEQNACWTQYDGDHPSVNTADVRDIIETGYQEEVESLFPIFVDNGTKTPLVDEIDDRMHGDGGYVGNAAGTDRYAPFDGTQDSWVVGLPVVECQSADHCAAGTAADMVGFVCFEIREVLVNPDKIIKGRFLCPSDPLFEECPIGPTGTGGDDFGIRADFPVLVR
jgi:Flp pilus assembly protein TadG